MTKNLACGAGPVGSRQAPADRGLPWPHCRVTDRSHPRSAVRNRPGEVRRPPGSADVPGKPGWDTDGSGAWLAAPRWEGTWEGPGAWWAQRQPLPRPRAGVGAGALMLGVHRHQWPGQTLGSPRLPRGPCRRCTCWRGAGGGPRMRPLQCAHRRSRAGRLWADVKFALD